MSRPKTELLNQNKQKKVFEYFMQELQQKKQFIEDGG